MISGVIEKLRVIVFIYRVKNDNSKLRIHLTGNSEISDVSKNSELITMAPIELGHHTYFIFEAEPVKITVVKNLQCLNIR